LAVAWVARWVQPDLPRPPLGTDAIFAWLLGLAWLALLITAHRMISAKPTRESSRRTPKDEIVNELLKKFQ
jgi:hypothetical protein